MEDEQTPEDLAASLNEAVEDHIADLSHHLSWVKKHGGADALRAAADRLQKCIAEALS